ncbi:MAG: hypothetical protein ACLFUH_11965 [Bacteroidales bacterium]
MPDSITVDVNITDLEKFEKTIEALLDYQKVTYNLKAKIQGSKEDIKDLNKEIADYLQCYEQTNDLLFSSLDMGKEKTVDKQMSIYDMKQEEGDKD